MIEAGSSFAGFVAKALGTAPEDVVGLAFGDYLKELRFRNADLLARNTEKILRERGVEEPAPIEPKALIAALEAASETSDETLQRMWAELLANAMDPNKDTSLQRVFIETLKQFEPIDAFVFVEFLQLKRKPDGYAADKAAQSLCLRKTLVYVSLDRLLHLKLLDQPRENYQVSALGEELFIACTGHAQN